MRASRRGLLLSLFAPGHEEWLDVDGQSIPLTCWERIGGALHALAPRTSFHDLRSAREVDDFEFSFEFKLAPGANSGVKYLVHKVDVWSRAGSVETQARARGFEFQLIDDEAGDALLDPTHVTGSLYGILAPSRRPSNPADGQFHSAMIRRRGPRVEHHVDGALVLEASLDSPGIQHRCAQRKMPPYSEVAKRRSAVALQHHNSEVWFRSLALKSLA